MKALIFSMTVGEGHNMIARSLLEAFESENVEAKIVQTFGYNEKEVKRQNALFLWTCKHIPHIYDFVWNKLRKQNKTTEKLPGYVKHCLKFFEEEISSYQPDIIVCTHYYASSVIAYMKRKGMLDEKIVTSTILFDFCLAPYWEQSKEVDFIFEPHTNTTGELIKKGYNESQIKAFGLPIRKAFFEEYDKDELRKRLNLKDMFTLMFIGGGNSLGNTLKLLKNVLKKNDDIQIIVINGKNKKNFEKIENYIEKNKIHNVVNLGFVSNIDEYMKSCDALISRCGSSVLSETLALKKPFIVREKMIINEKINKEYFMNEGCCLGLNKITDAGAEVKKLKSDRALYESMVENIERFRYPNPALTIAKFLIEEENKRKN